jgi:hypothetical protein
MLSDLFEVQTFQCAVASLQSAPVRLAAVRHSNADISKAEFSKVFGKHVTVGECCCEAYRAKRIRVDNHSGVILPHHFQLVIQSFIQICTAYEVENASLNSHKLKNIL